MKKVGRGRTQRVVMVQRASREFLASVALASSIDLYPKPHQGDVVQGENLRTGKVERFVLLRPLDAPDYLSGEDSDDFLTNQMTMRTLQHWEAAFVGASGATGRAFLSIAAAA